MVPAPRKALKLRRAFRLPGRVGTRSTSRGASFLPLPGEQPAMLLRVQVMGCRDLAGKNGSASVDPYVTISVLGKRHQTPVAKRNGSPLYVPKDATFDFPIYFSLADRLGVIEMVVWDRKDVLRKEYLGEVALSLEELFGEGAGADGAEISWASDQNKVRASVYTPNNA
ncbi:C2-domain-containing protein [Punctularia strigosozonata HHB-11173 SS5]|uniref:C2-domain-containing protein n=1 Tax=Punctularia strigosozonata (strain HHB-11173) TaxID=741275 RepID=UPI0004417784|nr:C2-domain-containing protein [Punctularia strigosozonata HHB-11173 SS5]EIN06938.1 C2-domain-containing protein [Punctularia strigosozonata HHB-11173 SS5]